MGSIDNGAGDGVGACADVNAGAGTGAGAGVVAAGMETLVAGVYSVRQ